MPCSSYRPRGAGVGLLVLLCSLLGSVVGADHAQGREAPDDDLRGCISLGCVCTDWGGQKAQRVGEVANPGPSQDGRVLPVFHQVGELPVTGAVLYGYPSGQTHPQAREATNDLLIGITRDIVLGRTGPRYVAGDFNHCPESLDEVRIWQMHGWTEIQTLANVLWQWEPQPTCKGVTQRDLLWVSPELAALCAGVSVHASFADHAMLLAKFRVPKGCSLRRTWALPSSLPWDQIQVKEWQQCQFPQVDPALPASEWYRSFAANFEDSLAHFAKDLPGSRIPKSCRGRARNVEPRLHATVAPLAKPSREGEVRLNCDLIGREVLQWYKQLRRLQSMTQALKANKQEANAQVYRAELWHCICNCKAFRGGFSRWWAERNIQLQGSPATFPLAIPSFEGCRIQEDFQANFRAFETWHGRSRARVLEAKYQSGKEQLFKELRKRPSEAVDTLQFQRSCTILAADPEGPQVHIEPAIDPRGSSSWTLDGEPCQVEAIEGSCAPSRLPASHSKVKSCRNNRLSLKPLTSIMNSPSIGRQSGKNMQVLILSFGRGRWTFVRPSFLPAFSSFPLWMLMVGITH